MIPIIQHYLDSRFQSQMKRRRQRNSSPPRATFLWSPRPRTVVPSRLPTGAGSFAAPSSSGEALARFTNAESHEWSIVDADFSHLGLIQFGAVFRHPEANSC